VSVDRPHLYRAAALLLGRDPATVDKAVQVATNLSATGAAPIFTLRHLAQLTGAPYRYLRDVVARRRDPYFEIVRQKRDGQPRPISSPEPVLMDVQRWILHHSLVGCTPHASSYAYQRGRSIVGCARVHVGARWLVKLDIHDFFGSVSERRVFQIFTKLGYPRLLSLELARLCTRAGPTEHIMRMHRRYQDAPPYEVNILGRLPQGAPTSGALANAVMTEVDAQLMTLAQQIGVVYTRYSDDLTFSTAAANFSRSDAATMIGHTSKILSQAGFQAHRNKTRVVPPGARHVVLGLLVDEAGVRLLPEFKRRVELHVRGVRRFGLAEHAAHRRFDSILSMIDHVDGCLAFAASVEEIFASTMRQEWEAALTAHGYRC
jgi:RNA-directed DNA polymerase